MSELIEKVMTLIKEYHGDKLNLADDYYQMVFPDGTIDLYFDEEEKTIKIEVNFIENMVVYKTDKTTIEELIS